MSPGLPKWYRSFWRGEFIELIELVNRIALVDEITKIGAIVAIADIVNIENLENIESVDLVDEITKITSIVDIAHANVRRNLLVNPGFETGDFRGWVKTGLPLVQPVPFEGVYSADLLKSTGVSQTVAAPLGFNVSIRYYAKAAVAGDEVQIRLTYIDDTTENIDQDFTTLWAGYSVAPTKDVALKTIRWYAKSGNAGDVYLDACVVEAIPYVLRDADKRAIGLPMGQYLATPGTLSDGEYSHLMLDEDKKLLTSDPTTQAYVDEVEPMLEKVLAWMAFLEDWRTGDYSNWIEDVYGGITDSIVSEEEVITDATKSGGDYWIYDETDRANQHRLKYVQLPPPPFTVEFKVKAETDAVDEMGQVGIGLTDADGCLQVWAGVHDAKSTSIEVYKVAIITGTATEDSTASGVSHDVRIEVTATDITVYFDDVQLATKAAAPSLKYLSIAVGAYGGKPFLDAGYLDDIRLTPMESSLPAAMLQVEKLKGNTYAYTAIMPSSISEEGVLLIETSTRKKLHCIFLDLTEFTQNATIRVKHKIDGTNYKTIKTISWTTADDDGVPITDIGAIKEDLIVTLQSAVAEGAYRYLPHYWILEDME